MLVLSRKTNESIVIDGDIVITIIRVKGKSVKLGIDAPSDKRIIRQELELYEVENDGTKRSEE